MAGGAADVIAPSPNGGNQLRDMGNREHDMTRDFLPVAEASVICGLPPELTIHEKERELLTPPP